MVEVRDKNRTITHTGAFEAEFSRMQEHFRQGGKITAVIAWHLNARSTALEDTTCAFTLEYWTKRTDCTASFWRLALRSTLATRFLEWYYNHAFIELTYHRIGQIDIPLKGFEMTVTGIPRRKNLIEQFLRKRT